MRDKGLRTGEAVGLTRRAARICDGLPRTEEHEASTAARLNRPYPSDALHADRARHDRQAGRLDPPARQAAIIAFRARHPDFERLLASEGVARIVAWAAQEHTTWFWKGVGLPERR